MKVFGKLSISVFSFLFFLLIKQGKKKRLLYFLPMALFCFSGCFVNYYSTGTKYGIGDTTVSALQDKGKYVIVHLKGEKVMSLKNITLRDSLIEADMEPVSVEHVWYLNPEPDSALSYKNKHKEVLNEVHIYALNQSLTVGAHLTLPDTAVSRLDIYSKNYGETASNHVISYLGVAALVLLIAFLDYGYHHPFGN